LGIHNQPVAAPSQCVENTPCPAIGGAAGFLQSMNWRDKILSDPQVLRGKSCIQGTRIPVALVPG
jgi:hypothetical protein